MSDAEFMHPQQCLSANLRKAARVATQLYQDPIRDSGLQGTQFTLLAALNGFGTCTLSELAAWVGIDQTTATRSIELLRRDGLVEVRPDAVDRRVRKLALTSAGRAALGAALPGWRDAQRHAVERFGREKARQLLALLAEFTALGRGSGVAEK